MTVKINHSQSTILMEAFLNVCTQLHLKAAWQADVLGVNEITIKRNQTTGFTNNTKACEIQAQIILMYRALYAICGGDNKLMLHWFNTQNKVLKVAPSEACKTVEGLINVNQYLNAMRGKV
ncbi:MbcA/ParS/Xre antitoxin family protein [Vibrio sp.]|nr:MbcA/ParS/Xre antitoxin family protein [Vibrio sp.]